MIKVEAVDISNISNIFPKHPNISNIFPGSAPFLQYSPIATSQLPSSLTKETANTSDRIYRERNLVSKDFFSFFDIAFDDIRLGPVPKFLEQKELE